MPTYYRNVAQTDWTRFSQLITRKMTRLPDETKTAQEIDAVVPALTDIVREAYMEACLQRQKRTRGPPIGRVTLEIVKLKRKLRREKSHAAAAENMAEVAKIQRQINIAGREVKKAQKGDEKENRRKLCEQLGRERDPSKYLKNIRKITDPVLNKSTTANRTKKIKDELGNITSTVQKRVDLFSNRLEHVLQTPDHVGFDNGWKVSVERYINQNRSSFIPNPLG